MCNVFSIKPFQDISGGPAVHEMTQSFLVQQMARCKQCFWVGFSMYPMSLKKLYNECLFEPYWSSLFLFIDWTKQAECSWAID